MDIKKLQEELIEKILLIPTEDNRSSLERTLEIINELERDHINDIITTNYGGFTALDYVIIADSQGNNPILSARPRINNMMLVKLENAIRNVGGKTSEELGPVQNEATLLRYAAMNGHLEVVRRLLEIEANINVANNHGATALHYAIENGDFEMVRYPIESHASTNLEGATVQSSIEGRGNSL